jgi:uncharacterized protein (DUF1684 family)
MLAVACADSWPEPPPVGEEEFAAAHAEWHQDRRDRLVSPPSGPLVWVGLWEIPQGSVVFGSDASLPIVLPEEDSPAYAGTLYREGQEVRLEPADGLALGLRSGDPIDRTVAGALVDSPLQLGDDRSDALSELTLGSLGLRLHAERGTDRLWLRAWDEDSPVRETFQLPEYFPLDPAWRVTARYEPYDEPRIMPVSDVTDGTVAVEAPGDLVFRVDGEEYRLIATAGETSRDFFVLLRDETARTETYEGMRYIHVPFPQDEGWTRDQAGWTMIDFNRTYSPPCAFTAFSVCALPPRENHLPIAVTAGEKKPADH